MSDSLLCPFNFRYFSLLFRNKKMSVVRPVLSDSMPLLLLLQTSALGSQGRENQPCFNNYLRPRHTIPFISSVHLFLVIFSQVALHSPGILNSFLFSQGFRKAFSGKQTCYCSQENVALIVTDISFVSLFSLAHVLKTTN